MSDDLFWPPLSGDDDANSPAGGEHPTRPLRYDAPGASVATEELASGRPTSDAGNGFSSGIGSSSGGGSSSGRGRHRWTGTATVAAMAAFIFGAGGVGVGAALHGNGGGKTTTNGAGFTVSSVAAKGLAQDPKSYAAIAAKLLPSVVSINVTGNNEADTGSGIVLRQDGYILTNNHVVTAAVGGGSVSATFNDGSTAGAKIVGTDSLDDLAVIKVTKSGLKPATLGTSSDLNVGDAVLAVGSPLGLSGTVTSGIVSALNRPVETQAEDQQQNTDPFGLGNGSGGSTQTQQPTVIDAIQTDAAINPGNSGGPLVDANGAVIGINSAIASLSSDSLGSSSQSGSIGVGFAIPIDQAKTIATELINTGKATHPLLGVELDPDSTTSAVSKATVHSVTAGGPAAKAGLKAGDVITAVAGQPTQGTDAVIAAIRTHQPGQQVTVTYTRGGSSKTVTVTLTSTSSQS
jgi:putative serine protease PepD